MPIIIHRELVDHIPISSLPLDPINRRKCLEPQIRAVVYLSNPNFFPNVTVSDIICRGCFDQDCPLTLIQSI
jgi:hypothetical protein